MSTATASSVQAPAPKLQTYGLCFHCGEPLLGSTLKAQIEGRDEPVCCQGCLAVAEVIAGAGLAGYYRFRDAAASRPDAAGLDRGAWEAYASPEIAAQFVRTAGERASVTLAIDGLRCAACSWLIDRALSSRDAVIEASTNAATGRTHVAWNRAQLTLADVLVTIAQLGYRPHPVSDAGVLQLQQRERRKSLRQLAVAGLGMMQVMMFAVAVYSAELAGEVMDSGLLAFFRIVSLLVATPVMFYAGAPILAGALRSARTRTIGMDVPVGIALALAYGASVWNTLSGGGQVYFDSVTMFIFFLSLSRFVQMSVRHRTTSVTDALARQLPSYAHRHDLCGLQDVPVSALRRGDLILVRPGEVLPADGELLGADARIDEAMLTGESLPVRRGAGERLAAGTLNVGNPIELRVMATASGTVLSHIVALLQRAKAQKPAMARTADAAAARFLRYVLLGTALTCGLWLAFDPSRAFEATLAVLVAACPCAFAIAMPAALSAAAARLAQSGVLIMNPDALERLASVDRIVFDKTGTLTRGAIKIDRCLTLADVSAPHCLQIAAMLEAASEHPLARAFAELGNGSVAQDVRIVAGCGLEGVVDGRRYRIGTAQFVGELHGALTGTQTLSELSELSELSATTVFLGDECRELACFELRDALRESAPAAIDELQRLKVPAQILSGDDHTAVADVASRCDVREYFARRSPTQKLAHVQGLQRDGRRVAMVGDGVNDAPVLAAAEVSIAIGRGAALAHASADMVLVGDSLHALPQAIRLARRTLQIARQNLVWSAVYNLASVPLAALGFIPPWLAALGMSLSSAAVVANAVRLMPRPCPPPSTAAAHGTSS